MKKRFYLDYSILIPYIVMCLIGIVMVYSASSYQLLINKENPAKYAINQSIFFVAGLLIITIIYKMKTRLFAHKNFVNVGMAFIGTLLVLTRYTPLGMTVNGARGWMSVPGIGQIQPAEFLKVMIIWYLASVLAARQTSIAKVKKGQWREIFLRPLLIVGVMIGLVLLQPDTGGAAILTLIAAVVVFASGINYMYTLIIGGGVTVISYLVIHIIVWSGGSIFPKSYQYVYNRFKVFANPFIDAQDSGHQMVNSYYALYNGGLFGRGLGNSIQKKGFLPEAHTDFMFSIVMEELGLIVSLIILGLLLFLILRIILVGVRSKSPFNSMMCIGIGGMFLIQTFINIGGISGIIPLTGVTFPFISQGGSSLLMLSIAIGMVLNISADEKRKKEQLGYRYQKHV